MSTLRFISNVQNTSQFSPIPLNNHVMPITSRFSYNNAVTITNRPKIEKQPELIEEKGPKKMSWGEPTWFLFHTLAEKIKESSFNDVRAGFLNIVYTICVNLPCPDCATHAKQFLDGSNFNAITTKAQLKKFLFDFHNLVNQRKHFPIYPFKELDNKYSTANTKNIIYYFIYSFEKKNKSIRLIADDIHRQRVSVIIKEWLNNNIVHFEV